MASYCTRTRLTDNLPDDLPAGMDSTFMDNQIAASSFEVDELVGFGFTRQYKTNTQKFPDITDDPATPKTIENCALWLALSLCYEKLDVENEGDEVGENKTSRRVYYRNKAIQQLEKIRNGVVDLNVTAEAGVEAQDKYMDDSDEEDKEWIVKKSELDTLYP